MRQTGLSGQLGRWAAAAAIAAGVWVGGARVAHGENDDAYYRNNGGGYWYKDDSTYPWQYKHDGNWQNDWRQRPDMWYNSSDTSAHTPNYVHFDISENATMTLDRWFKVKTIAFESGTSARTMNQKSNSDAGIDLYGGIYNHVDMAHTFNVPISLKADCTIQNSWANSKLTFSKSIYTGSGDAAKTLTFQANDGDNPSSSATTTVSGVISQDGSVVKNSISTLILSGDNTYTGSTTVNKGTLQIGGGTSSGKGSITGDVSVDANGLLDICRTGSWSYGGNLSGAGPVYKRGTVAWTLTGASASFAGTLNIGSNTVTINREGNWGGTSSKIIVQYNSSDKTQQLHLSGGVHVKSGLVSLEDSRTCLYNDSGANSIDGTLGIAYGNTISSTAGELTIETFGVSNNVTVTGAGDVVVNLYTNTGANRINKTGTGTLTMIGSAGGAARRAVNLSEGRLKLAGSGVLTNLVITNCAANCVIEMDGAHKIKELRMTSAGGIIEMEALTTTTCEKLDTETGIWFSSDLTTKFKPGTGFDPTLNGTWELFRSADGSISSAGFGHLTVDVSECEPFGGKFETNNASGVITLKYLAPPKLGTATATGVGARTATLTSSVIANNTKAVEEYGFVYSTSETAPTTATGTKVIVASAAVDNNVEWSKVLTGLTPNTTYYFRSYAINASGTGYSTVGTFTTPAIPAPTLTARGVDGNSFLLNWSDTGGTDVYNVQLGTSNPLDEVLADLNEDFNDWTAESQPAIGTDAGAQSVQKVYHGHTYTLGTENTTGLRNRAWVAERSTGVNEISFNYGKAFFETDVITGTVNKIVFEIRAGSTSSSDNQELSLQVMTNGVGTWATLGEYYPSANATYDTIVCIPPEPLQGGTAGLKFRFYKDIAADANSTILTRLGSFQIYGRPGHSENMTGLSSGTTYYTRVRESGGTWANAMPVKAGVVPGDVTGTGASLSSVRFDWEAPSVAGVTGYRIDATLTNVAAAGASWTEQKPPEQALSFVNAANWGGKPWCFTNAANATQTATSGGTGTTTVPSYNASYGYWLTGIAGNTLMSTNFPIGGASDIKLEFTVHGWNLNDTYGGIEVGRVNAYYRLDEGPWCYLGTAIPDALGDSGTADFSMSVPQGALDGTNIAFKITAPNARQGDNRNRGPYLEKDTVIVTRTMPETPSIYGYYVTNSLSGFPRTATSAEASARSVTVT
ncbi:MAG: autotransporter-associated beta strand repeat-containing protein, partial [Kiritimatiellae bacterium]|nr:autotransporter-associated beta strand repeat-containing protein [Kiritimatiellia bacterium]